MDRQGAADSILNGLKRAKKKSDKEDGNKGGKK